MTFEELDYCSTPIGELILRRRREPRLADREIFEVKLGDEFLMSSLFTTGEIALADLGLQHHPGGALDVLVGGLGLGYTAAAVLQHETVKSLQVIEYLPEIIKWHRQELVPLGTTLRDDPRCRLVQGDFFGLAADPATGFDPGSPGRRYDALLVDIDHSPRHQLAAGNEWFYRAAGLRTVARHLRPGGVFGLWSNDSPDPGFEAALDEVFEDRESHVVRFDNPYTGGEAASTVYLASVPA